MRLLALWETRRDKLVNTTTVKPGSSRKRRSLVRIQNNPPGYVRLIVELASLHTVSVRGRKDFLVYWSSNLERWT